MIYGSLLKRVFDKIFALLLVILSPLFLIVTILGIQNHGYPFFVQVRAGKYGKPFKIIKFKTMNDNCDEDGKLLPDTQRLTKVGIILRKTSVDELPQLVNVLKGDLSFVGPRPLLMQYLPHYNVAQARRHDVKPGITGWAQVSGRQLISFAERFELDVWYVKNLSLILDFKILVRTLKNVMKSSGVIENEGAWKE